jgi:hypothetical protein
MVMALCVWICEGLFAASMHTDLRHFKPQERVNSCLNMCINRLMHSLTLLMQSNAKEFPHLPPQITAMESGELGRIFWMRAHYDCRVRTRGTKL